eukprot:TRINITY_DN27700_c0_g1_i2.p1 TRINITY_DN27700_c0_g1~~TRINITY_DN27700_c0_g1_i2.p1  ORF type:complete len:603 (+),score=105.56 TRINITY_DN27700_c0_g1_i2:23-1810(+)
MISYKDDDLWQAVGQRDIAGVRRALAAGGDVNMVCGDVWVRDEVAGKRGTGRSLLHHAAWAGDLEIFKVLVAAGANCGRRRTTAWRPNGGVQGRGAGRELGLTQATPLHHAVMYKRQDIVEYLLTECRVDVDEPGEQGYTALHLAAKFDYSNIAELLLRAGARTDLITRDEKTVWDFAKGQQDRSSHAQEGAVKRLLEQYDAGGSRRDRALPMASRARRAGSLPPQPLEQQQEEVHKMLNMPCGRTVEGGCAARLLSADGCMPSGASDVSTDAGTNASSDARSTASNASARLVAAMRGSCGLAANSEEWSSLGARAPPRRHDALGLLPGLRGPTRPVRARPRPAAEAPSRSMGSQALPTASPAAGVVYAAVESVEWQAAGGRNGAVSPAARLVEAMAGNPRAQASTPPSRKKNKSVAFALLDEGSCAEAAADSLDALQAELQRRGIGNGRCRDTPQCPTPGTGEEFIGRALHESMRQCAHDADSLPQGPLAHGLRGSNGSPPMGGGAGSRSTVRQSKLFRMYESGNAAKAILGQDSLQWNVNLKEGAYHGRVFDAYEGHSSCAAGAADGREARKGGRGPDAPSLWRTTAGAYGAG